jgi:diadenylate cyclase
MKNLIHLFRWQDLLDIAVISFVTYKILAFLKDTRTLKILVGAALFLFVTYFLTDFFHLSALNWILSNFISSIFVILVIIFNPEIRRGLMIVGRGAILRPSPTAKHTEIAEEVIRAVNALSLSKIGALIVFQRGDDLKEFIEDSTLLNAKVTKELLLSIFHPAAPLHDGAIIIKDSVIKAAGCFLPLTTRANLSKTLGTRHRAGIGVTEETDAICVIVSEETGNISVAVDGKITMKLEGEILDRLLFKLLFGIKKTGKV